MKRRWGIFFAISVFSFWAWSETKPSTPSLESLQIKEPTDEPIVDLPSLSLDKDGAITLTLENSISLALRTATSVLFAQNSQYVSGATLLQSYGQFLPNLTAKANYTYATGAQYYTQAVPTTVTGSNVSAGYSLSCDLNIFNGLYDLAHLKSSLSRKAAADLSLLRAKQAISLDVTQSYLTVVLDNRQLSIARKNLQESQARERLLLEQTRVGAKNLSDLFRQQAQTSADESLVLTSDNKQRADQITLLQKLRLDVSKSYHIVDPELPEEKSEPRFENETDLLKLALGNRTDLKASNETAKAAHWDVRGSFSGYLPKLDLIGSVGSMGSYLYTQSTPGQNLVPPSQTNLFSQLPHQMESTIGLYLTWTLFDRFETHQSIATAEAAARDADISASDQTNQVQADVRVAYGNYKTALQQLRTSKKGEEAAQKAYEVIEGRYEVGSASFIDLVTVQADLLQAELARAQALINFILQAKSIDFAIGDTKTE